MKIFLIVFVLIVMIFYYVGVDAYTMSSPNYHIQSDSLNTGGAPQNSTNYKSEDTLGEIGSGLSTSASYKIKAGYQQMPQDVYISLSLSTSSVFMLPEISGMSGGISNGNLTATVITDNSSGYLLSVFASTSPAIKCKTGSCNPSADNFLDYTPVSAGVPDYNWLISATTSEFGFTPEGADIVQKFLDNTSNICATGTSATINVCWYNFSTSSEIIAQSSSANHPTGTDTVVKFQAESGSENIQAPGEYEAIITIIATTN